MRLTKMDSNDTYTVQIVLKNGETKQFFAGLKLDSAIELLKDLIDENYYNIQSANVIVTTTTIMNMYSKEG